MFGGSNMDEPKLSSAKLGINGGFTAEEFFIPVGAEDGSWRGWQFQLSGPIDIKHTVFLPTPTPRANWREDDTEAKVTARYHKALKAFDATLKSFMTCFHPMDKKFPNLPTFADVPSFVAGINDYVEALANELPQNYTSVELEVILGRGKDRQGKVKEFLNMPSSVNITGRFIKRADDTERTMGLSDIFKKNYMFEVVPGGNSEDSNVDANAVSTTDWGV